MMNVYYPVDKEKIVGEKIKLYNVNDGLAGRDGGPYLDEVEAAAAEVIRAKREGREPDAEPGPYVGTQLITEAQRLNRGVGVPIPSREDVESEVLLKGVREVTAQPKAEIDPVETAGKFVNGAWTVPPEEPESGEPEQTDLLKELEKSAVEAKAPAVKTEDHPKPSGTENK